MPVLAAARARSGHTTLALLATTVAAGLVTVTAVVGATVHAGQDAGSWDAVGADVAVEVPEPEPGLRVLAEGLERHDGVTTALTARVDDGVQLRGPGFGRRIRLVVVDASELGRLTAATPLPDVPGDLISVGSTPPAAPRPDGSVPALVSPVLRPAGGERLALQWNGVRVPLAVVGTAVTPGGGDAPAVVVDAATLAVVAGQTVAPNTVWVTGPGAEAAVAATPALADADVVERSAWLADRRAAPLTVGVGELVTAVGAVLVLLAVVLVVLSAAGGAHERTATLARLRTLGLSGRQAWWVTAGEMLPAVTLSCVGGSALGLAVAHACLDALDLGRLTGQSGTPALVVPWLAAAPLLACVATVLAVVAVERAARRSERLGQALRIG